MSKKVLQTAEITINLLGSADDLTPDWVYEQLDTTKESYEFGEIIFSDFNDQKVIAISIPSSYTAKGANRSDLDRLATQLFGGYGFVCYVPPMCDKITKVADDA